MGPPPHEKFDPGQALKLLGIQPKPARVANAAAPAAAAPSAASAPSVAPPATARDASAIAPDPWKCLRCLPPIPCVPAWGDDEAAGPVRTGVRKHRASHDDRLLDAKRTITHTNKARKATL